jgi:hypothetical protein
MGFARWIGQCDGGDRHMRDAGGGRRTQDRCGVEKGRCSCGKEKMQISNLDLPLTSHLTSHLSLLHPLPLPPSSSSSSPTYITTSYLVPSGTTPPSRPSRHTRTPAQRHIARQAQRLTGPPGTCRDSRHGSARAGVQSALPQWFSSLQSTKPRPQPTPTRIPSLSNICPFLRRQTNFFSLLVPPAFQDCFITPPASFSTLRSVTPRLASKTSAPGRAVTCFSLLQRANIGWLGTNCRHTLPRQQHPYSPPNTNIASCFHRTRTSPHDERPHRQCRLTCSPWRSPSTDRAAASTKPALNRVQPCSDAIISPGYTARAHASPRGRFRFFLPSTKYGRDSLASDVPSPSLLSPFATRARASLHSSAGIIPPARPHSH